MGQCLGQVDEFIVGIYKTCQVIVIKTDKRERALFYLFLLIQCALRKIFLLNSCIVENIFLPLQRFKGNRKAVWWL